MTPTASGNATTDYKGDSGITFLASVLATNNAKSVIEEILSKLDGASIDYRLDKENRQVVAFTNKYGVKFYIRFDRIFDRWSGVTIFYRGNSDYWYLVSAISADFAADGREILGANMNIPAILQAFEWIGAGRPETPDGKAASSASRPPEAPKKTEKESPAIKPTELVAAGTAFAISPDGRYVTNFHVIDGCAVVRLETGKVLTVVASDARRDVAILKSGEATNYYLKFRRDQTVDLAEGVYLAGYPYYGRVSTSLNFTNGIVTSLRGIADNVMHFQINANMQPGNSGGPVLDSAGAVIGVAVARLSDTKSLKDTGTVPQSMNYAIRGSVIESFLLENNILTSKYEGPSKVDLPAMAKDMQNSVVPVLCYK